FLENEPYHFSISHCGDYAAVIISKTSRVGVDVELINEKIGQIQHKFMSKTDLDILQILFSTNHIQCLILCWSVKESVFKWWGKGAVDCKKDIVLQTITGLPEQGVVHCLFKNETRLAVHYLFFNDNFLTWVLTDH